jgi:hypothetical protein
MILHANIYIRSFYNLGLVQKKHELRYINYNKTKESMMKRMINKFKSRERQDLNHKIDFVIGVDNMKQLKENMEYFPC